MKPPCSLALFAFIVAALAASASAQPAAGNSKIEATLRADKPGPVISKNIYGQFAEHLGRCIYEGIWVGPDSSIPNIKGYRTDVVEALKKLSVPQLRWPGGCFADEYHWRDGIGPREKRPSMYNSHWGGVVENNHFGTHEFLDFCELIGTEPYVCLNVGSGTVQEAMEWVEYMTSDAQSPMANLRRANGREKPWKVPFLAVGNESWGCGGNMRPEFYADNYRRYNTFVKDYNRDAYRFYRVAGGPNASDYNWTEVLMTIAGKQMSGLSLHYYTLPTGSWRGSKGKSTGFGEAEWFATISRTLFMDELLSKHIAIMDRHDPEKKVGLVVDEWGTWYDVEAGTNTGFLYQQNTVRDAIVAGLNLHLFHKYADRVSMANIAQMINVLQAMILTDKEKMVLTPTYHVFEMYKPHQHATLLPVEISSPNYTFDGKSVPAVSASASRDSAGAVHLSLVNCEPNKAQTVSCRLVGLAAKTVTGRILTGPAMDSRNTFESPNTVEPQAFAGATLKSEIVEIVLPAKAVVMLELK
ncbi:MAG: alpha-N-arabinofuranosidase [Nibricoccus sp.]